MSWPARHTATLLTVVATVCAVILSWPVAIEPARLLYGYPGDATGTVAIFWWWSYALHHGRPLLDNTLVGGPLGSGWELIPFDVLQVALMAPLSYLFGPVAAYNLFALVSYPLTALFTFLLSRRLGAGRLAASFSALAFAFMPYHTEKAQAHLMQAHMEFLPAFMWLALRWRDGGSWWNVAGTGLVAGLTLWNDTYMAYVLVVMAIAFAIVSIAGKSTGTDRGLIQHLWATALVLAVAALFVPAWAWIDSRAGGEATRALVNAIRRPEVELRMYAARPLEYLMPWHANPLVPGWIRAYENAHLHDSNFIEQSLFIGYTVMVLTTLGILSAVRGRRLPVAIALVVALMGGIFSMPPSPRLAGLTLHFPSYWLHDYLTVFRVYARFGMLVMLGASLLAGFGLEAIASRLRGRANGFRTLLVLPFLMLALEFNDVPPSRVTAVLPGPPEYQWLRSQPQGLLLEYPLHAGNPQEQERETRQYSMYQMVHEHAVFNGADPYSRAGQYETQLEPYYAADSVARMRALGVRYVFVHRSDYVAAGYETPKQVPGLVLVASLGDTDVFEVEDGR